jgi:hypothetical protein
MLPQEDKESWKLIKAKIHRLMEIWVRPYSKGQVLAAGLHMPTLTRQ